jgi:hypothetical protein
LLYGVRLSAPAADLQIEERSMPIQRPLPDYVALVASVLLFLAAMVGAAACGNDDLFFPGELPPTPEFTATPEVTATPDEVEG